MIWPEGYGQWLLLLQRQQYFHDGVHIYIALQMICFKEITISFVLYIAEVHKMNPVTNHLQDSRQVVLYAGAQEPVQ